ncbi:hypothetical protein QBC32DRAFT_30321 [Pseudoneurospora amorphoporcata]|uniref:Uncharacterized protein n=1 Tax=Pseudoneurospora amorphoporcata TaxID=241081 RepID=A0AAN6SCZ6_9PEZI|nr:hypothetical protein QBC32DRAFT_30321 [Pseudoneurospora amorphoporcata]
MTGRRQDENAIRSDMELQFEATCLIARNAALLPVPQAETPVGLGERPANDEASSDSSWASQSQLHTQNQSTRSQSARKTRALLRPVRATLASASAFLLVPCRRSPSGALQRRIPLPSKASVHNCWMQGPKPDLYLSVQNTSIMEMGRIHLQQPREPPAYIHNFIVFVFCRLVHSIGWPPLLHSLRAVTQSHNDKHIQQRFSSMSNTWKCRIALKIRNPSLGLPRYTISYASVEPSRVVKKPLIF